MTQEEIRTNIDNLNSELTQITTQFILNTDTIDAIQEKIKSLQDQCIHKFENGKCIYCDVEE